MAHSLVHPGHHRVRLPGLTVSVSLTLVSWSLTLVSWSLTLVSWSRSWLSSQCPGHGSVLSVPVMAPAPGPVYPSTWPICTPSTWPYVPVHPVIPRHRSHRPVMHHVPHHTSMHRDCCTCRFLGVEGVMVGRLLLMGGRL